MTSHTPIKLYWVQRIDSDVSTLLQSHTSSPLDSPFPEVQTQKEGQESPTWRKGIGGQCYILAFLPGVSISGLARLGHPSHASHAALKGIELSAPVQHLMTPRECPVRLNTPDHAQELIPRKLSPPILYPANPSQPIRSISQQQCLQRRLPTTPPEVSPTTTHKQFTQKSSRRYGSEHEIASDVEDTTGGAPAP